jgi:predicted nucleic-acid-binding protein
VPTSLSCCAGFWPRRISGASEDLAWRAQNEYEAGKADFADFVIGLSGREEKAVATYTFDRRAAGSALFRLVKA